MRMRSLSRVISAPVLMLTLAMALGPVPGLAASSGDPRAKAAFRAAQKHYDLGEFQKALDGYADAYKLSPLPAFLFNMAQCHRQLGNYERAASYYGRFLEAAPADSANTRLARDLLKDMQAKQKSQAATTPAVPDAPRVPPSPGDPPLNEYPRGSAEVTSVPSETRPLTASPPPLAGSALAESTAAARPSDSVLKKWWFWTAIGGGVAVITVIAVVASPHPRAATLADIDARR